MLGNIIMGNTLIAGLQGQFTIFGDAYSDKYHKRSSGFTDKHSDQGSAFNDKYSGRSSNFTDKFG
ncbi:hypothetical protein KAR28_04385 [Candidatus Parcubacteria bacterium]|nr:hypothetical protein [Candidatus Parcubacteria bacterium]